jgi:CrcB protein
MRFLDGYLLVFLGAGLGGALRHAVNTISIRAMGPSTPVATLIVNVAGSLALGAVAGYFATRGPAVHAVHLFLATGVLGGFTTFSAFSLEAALLWERGQLVSFGLYTLGSVALSIAAVFAGLGLVRLNHAS